MSTKYNTVALNGFRVPATFHDAVSKIKDGFEKGKVSFESVGLYQVTDPHRFRNVYCPIGYLLTVKQRDLMNDFGQENENAVASDAPWKHFGEKNLQVMLGMCRSDAAAVQNTFDELGTNALGLSTKDQRKGFTTLLNEMLTRPNYKNPALA